MGQREYAAFISYRHKPLDREAAIAVQKKVEHFRVSKEYRGQTGGKKIGYVFRDEDELPTSSSLSDSIRDALSHSKHLIVICTPDLPQSKWCEEEIRYFLETHPRDDVIAVLVSGEPEESFPPLLTHVYGPDGEVIERIEPLAANITGDAQHFSRKRFTKESVRICAALIGCPFDELWHRERRYRMQRFAAAGAAGFAAMAVFAGFLAVKNRQISLKNEQITAQNEQITAQNGQITAQNLALKEREGKLLIDGGKLLLEGSDLSAAARNAVQALQIEEVHTNGAEKLLADSLGAYSASSLRRSVLVSQETGIENCEAFADGTLFTADNSGVVRAYEPDGSVRWTAQTVPPKYRVQFMKDPARISLTPVREETAVLCSNPYKVVCLSASDGAVLWELEKQYTTDFIAVSEDRAEFAVFNAKEPDTVSVFDAEDGSERMMIGFPEMGEQYDSFYNMGFGTLDRNFGGCFTEDGRYFLFGAAVQGKIPMDEPETEDTSVKERTDLMVYCGIDLKEKAGWMIGTEEIRFGINTIFGMDYDPETGKTFVVRYDDADREVTAGEFLSDGTMERKWGSTNIRVNSTKIPWHSLTGGQYRVVTAGDSVYFMDRASGDFIGRYELGDNVVGAWWADRTEPALFVLEEDGEYHLYLPGVEAQIPTQGSIGVEHIGGAAHTGAGLLSFDPEEGFREKEGDCIFVYSGEGSELNERGRLLKAQLYTDPRIRQVPEDIRYSALAYASVTPDGLKLRILEKKDSPLLITIDLLTGKRKEETLAEQAAYAFGSDRSRAVLPDGTGEISGCRIFLTDGTETVFEAADKDRYYDFAGSCDTQVLTDGNVLSACVDAGDKNAEEAASRKERLRTWINGKEAASAAPEGGSFILGYRTSGLERPGSSVLLRCGANGCTVTGFRREEEERFSGYLTLDPDGTAQTVEAKGGAMPYSIVRPGEEKQVLSALEEDGVLRVYDLSGETPEITEITDSEGFGGAVDMTFAAHDRYLCVLDHSGYLRIFDAVTGECMLREYDDGLSGFAEITAIPAGEDRLILRAHEADLETASHAVLYDLTEFERCADIPNLLGYSAETGEVILFRSEKGEKIYLRCPLYDAEALMEYAD